MSLVGGNVPVDIAGRDGLLHQVSRPPADAPADFFERQGRQAVTGPNVIDTGGDARIGIGQRAVEVEENGAERAAIVFLGPGHW
jgi:hypothetical protein